MVVLALRTGVGPENTDRYRSWFYGPGESGFPDREMKLTRLFFRHSADAGERNHLASARALLCHRNRRRILGGSRFSRNCLGLFEALETLPRCCQHLAALISNEC